MEQLEVGCEVIVHNLKGRHKILEVKGTKAKIQFGCCIMHIDTKDIIKIYSKKKPFYLPQYHLKRYEDFLDFNTTIDLHGCNIQEGLKVLDIWLQQGRALGHRRFKIIHGKGNGILRAQVKKFLHQKKMDEFSYDSDCGGATILDF